MAATTQRKLSENQKKALAYKACGLTAEEIAARMGTSVHSARNHVTRAQEKLGARNGTHAVVRALVLNLIKLPIDGVDPRTWVAGIEDGGEAP